MDWPTISKSPPASGPNANLADYDTVCRSFRWSDATAQLGLCGDVDSPVNIAEVAVEAHLKAGSGGRNAVRWLAKNGTTTSLTYEDLARQSRRFAGALEELGVEKEDVVCSLLGRVPELYITALGTWRRGAVFCPLFSAFGPEPAKSRMSIGSPPTRFVRSPDCWRATNIFSTPGSEPNLLCRWDKTSSTIWTESRGRFDMRDRPSKTVRGRCIGS